MPKSKNTYFERQVPREIMRPFSEQLNLFMGFSPLLPAPCPFSSSLTGSSNICDYLKNYSESASAFFYIPIKKRLGVLPCFHPKRFLFLTCSSHK
ncbi:hypothetical protein [Nostoc sp.]|uniref:hypothetical protein n=1 Tax=Nostoc sp. TaxID=1180 RepID=UPI002FF7520C